MKTKWCDLFILGLMQSSDHVGLRRMLDAMSSHLSACSKIGQLKQEKFEEVDHQIKQLLQLQQRFENVKLSAIEFAYLKLISFTANGLFELVQRVKKQIQIYLPQCVPVKQNRPTWWLVTSSTSIS